MVEFTKVDLDITEYKPKMKPVYVSSVKDLNAIPFALGETVQVKADGEFSFIHVDKQECYAVNRFGRKTTDLPALQELRKMLIRRGYGQVELLAELYGVDENGKPVTLPNFIHMLKGDDAKLQEHIHLGIFDIISEDGFSASALQSRRKLEMIYENFNGKLAHVLEYAVPNNQEIIETYYEDKIREGWEGLVIRVNGDTYKAKPNCDVDAVIIGINKNTKGYEKGLAKSVRVALMREDGNFIELGDATVPSMEEARELFTLTRVVRVYETPETVFVRPIIVVQISYISLFPDTINTVRASNILVETGKTSLSEIGTTKFVRMKSPRVVGYRKDKQVCVSDIGVNQVGE